jgi:hypothetical protein
VQTPYGFTVPTIFYRSTVEKTAPRPMVLLGNGFNGAQEEFLHVLGLAALERGINVITYEVPGQCFMVRNQGLGFISDWEKVTMPPPAVALFNAGKKEELDAAITAMLKKPGVSSSARWGIEHCGVSRSIQCMNVSSGS